MLLANEPSAAYFARLLEIEIVSVESMDGGINSRVRLLTTVDGEKYVAKIYHGVTADNRDRREVECNAIHFLRDHGFECIPTPVVIDPTGNCAIFEYIHGIPADHQEITIEDIDKSTRFLSRLGDLERDAVSSLLPSAAEACFSLQAIVDNLRARLSKLNNIGASNGAAVELSRFLTNEFSHTFQQTINKCVERAARSHRAMNAELTYSERTLSPSDFGFHNAIRKSTGDLVFLDFEYFGWDDPAKLISDFLLHPAMKLKADLKSRFVANIMRHRRDDRDFNNRLEIVFPLFGLKWCLIILNAFLPQHIERRRLTDSSIVGNENLQEQQLEKAKLMLSAVERGNEGFPYPDQEDTINVR